MKKVCIVEDDAIIALLLEKKVQRLGYDVLFKCDTAEGAIARMRSNPADLLLMDIKLASKMDGVDAVSEIRTFSDIPVIYLTGNADNQTHTRAMQTDPVAYLVKPIDMNQLGNFIEKALGTSDAQ